MHLWLCFGNGLTMLIHSLMVYGGRLTVDASIRLQDMTHGIFSHEEQALFLHSTAHNGLCL